MKLHLDAAAAMSSAMQAATSFSHLLTDQDPDDGDHVVPGELRRFLARLRLLHGVPFSYLVPDAALLPVESIRFFHIDRAWTDALVQGALSVGTVSTLDHAHLEAVYPHIRDEVDRTERAVRAPVLNGSPATARDQLDGPAGTITGCLLRSRLVSGWPGLHVRAYARDVLPDDALSTVAEDDPSRLKLLRMERLAPAVLLVLFDGLPEVVHIEEPRQGVQFGVRLNAADPPSARKARVALRNATDGALVPPINALTAGNSVEVPFRAGASGVIDVAELRKRLAAKVPNAASPLPASGLALQMLRFPYRQVFGDPSDEQGLHFQALDSFRPSVALADWKVSLDKVIKEARP
ncbi:MAG: hypothetical protein CFE46_00920 [Burkholderiales bacterium PBB6]|nr:MAG: hypothetical protein CFE46_00920 [Burkholderiales bacterium PBB6]